MRSVLIYYSLMLTLCLYVLQLIPLLLHTIHINLHTFWSSTSILLYLSISYCWLVTFLSTHLRILNWNLVMNHLMIDALWTHRPSCHVFGSIVKVILVIKNLHRNRLIISQSLATTIHFFMWKWNILLIFILVRYLVWVVKVLAHLLGHSMTIIDLFHLVFFLTS